MESAQPQVEILLPQRDLLLLVPVVPMEQKAKGSQHQAQGLARWTDRNLHHQVLAHQLELQAEAAQGLPEEHQLVAVLVRIR